MRILLVLGNAADTGGPTKYAMQLQPALERRGHSVEFATSAPWLWKVPFGIRHLFFAMHLAPAVRRADVVLGFDTMTVGMPLFLVSFFTSTPYYIRIGGDFVWEQFVESTGRLVKLSRFYQTKGIPLKQRFEIYLTGLVVRRAAGLIFNSGWLRDLWRKVYRFDDQRAFIAENLYPQRESSPASEKRTFVAAGRPIKLKQEPLLREVFEKLKSKYPDIELDTAPLPPKDHASRVARSYAVVLPSVSDVSPNVIIDAVALGKPFICTDDTGIKERLLGTGLFVDTADPQALSSAMEVLLDHKKYAEVAARVRAFSFVRSWDDVAADVEAAFLKR